MKSDNVSHSRLPAVLSAVLLLTATACGLEESGPAPAKDASATSDAKAGAAGKGGGAGSGGAGVAGNFGGGAGSVATAGNAGAGGTAGGDVADADVDATIDVAPPPMCPANAVRTEGTGLGLKGDYFTGQDLTTLKVTRYDAKVDFDWGTKAPEVGVPADHFSVRWTGQVQPRYSDMYTFSTDSDDGIRVTVNNMVVVENFTDHAATHDVGTPIMLVGGQKYDIKVEYYDNTLNALAKVSWESLCQTAEVVPQSQLYYQAPVCAAAIVGTGTGLKGEYYDNQDLTNLLATHAVEGVDYTWQDMMVPDPAIAPGTYSVRWTGQVQAKFTESVTFTTTSDDGVRLFVDDLRVIDNWTDHGTFDDSGTVTLVAGQKYSLRLEFYNNGGAGQIKLSWSSGCMPTKTVIPVAQLYPTYTGAVCTAPTVGTGTGLKGEYYNTMSLTDLKVTHPAEAVDFDFPDTPDADAGVGADMFSVRWTGQVQARYTGPTTFHTLSDDGVRLWIGGVLVIDNWTDHAPTENTGVVTLVAGQKYDVRLEFFENTGGAHISLFWSGPCEVMQPIPATQLYPTGYTLPEGGFGGGAVDGG